MPTPPNVRPEASKKRLSPSAQAQVATKTSLAGWLLIGSGAALALSGGGLYLSGWATFWRLEDGKDVTYDQGQAARLRSGVGIGVMVSGAVALILGLVWPKDEVKLVTVQPAEQG